MAKKAAKVAPEIISIGQAVFIRTVTHYYTGRIVALSAGWITLGEAAWIACTARFADTLARGTLQEVEPYPGDGLVAISVGAIVDVSPWMHALPRAQA